MRPNNSLILNALPANANQVSTVVWALDIVRASFQWVATGTAAGTLNVQASNDQAFGAPANQFLPTNWATIATIAVPSSGPFNSGEIETSYEYLRVTYTDGSGGTATGTISVRMKSMGL